MIEFRAVGRTLIDFLVVGICTFMFAVTSLGLALSVLGKNAAGANDFVEYWASGRQLVIHANPYDVDAITRIERSVGFSADSSFLVMPNPPSALLLVYPLGFFGARTAEVLWFLASILVLVVSIRIVWILHGRPNNKLHVLGYLFAPALTCLLAGQIAIFILFGLVLFLRFHRTSPFWAGFALWLCMLKPHLFVPFGAVLIVWVILTRSYRVLAGVVVALSASSLIAIVLDPHVWVHYAQMMKTARVDSMAIPCLSVILRRTVGQNALWVQYVPVVLGTLWALSYFWQRRENWNWVENGSPLMLVSVLVAPYTWFMDQAILIPALLHGAYVTRSRGLIYALALASALIEIESMVGLKLGHSVFFLWTAPAWLFWYLIATNPRFAISADSRFPFGNEGRPLRELETDSAVRGG